MEQIDSSMSNLNLLTPEEKVKNLQDKLSNVKLTYDNKEALMEIFSANKGDEHERGEMKKFLSELGESQKNTAQKKQVEKVAPLFTNHDFWDSMPVPK